MRGLTPVRAALAGAVGALVAALLGVVRTVRASVPFVFDNPFVFHDRYDGTALDSTPRRAGRNRMQIDVIDDTLAFRLEDQKVRGTGATNMHWSMSANSMLDLHAAEIPSRLYKRAHRHSSDAFILMLSGRGYSLTWPGGRYDRRIRIEWHEGTMFVPPDLPVSPAPESRRHAGTVLGDERVEARGAARPEVLRPARARHARDLR